jgi:hypothetical protein
MSIGGCLRYQVQCLAERAPYVMFSGRSKSRILKSALNHEDYRNQPCAFAIEKDSEVWVQREASMSLINGDKSRANRERKQNIQRRLRTQALLQAEAAKTKQAGVPKKVKSAVRPEPVAQ